MTTAEATARQILAANGVEGEPHPALLEDTIREVEYHGVTFIDFETTASDVEVPAGFTVEKQEFEMPCEHLACDLLHRRFYNGTYDQPQSIIVYNMQGDAVAHRMETRYHSRQVVQWSIVGPDGYAVESYDTKREALDNLPRFTA